MCEHELKQALLDIEFLQECNNSLSLALSVTRKELAAANARIAELEATLKEIAKGNIVYPDLFAQQSLKDTKNSGCPYGVQPSKSCCKGCNELENILFKCNQEIVKQACKTEQLQQQLVAANQRAEQAEAQCAAMRNCHNCKNYDMQWDNDGDWVQRCKHNDTEHDACGKLMKWEAEGNG